MKELISITIDNVLVEISRQDNDRYTLRVLTTMREVLATTTLTALQLRVMRIAIRAVLEEKIITDESNGDIT